MKEKLSLTTPTDEGRYMVFAEKGEKPKHIHASFEEARKEAEWIAAKSYPQWVRILEIKAEIKGVVEVKPMPLPNASPALPARADNEKL
jgi:hypothetical protein